MEIKVGGAEGSTRHRAEPPRLLHADFAATHDSEMERAKPLIRLA